jgi:hypothetical protein
MYIESPEWTGVKHRDAGSSPLVEVPHNGDFGWERD